MKIHADLSKPAAARLDDLPWRPSPDGSVRRRMLDRDGGEVARATSVVAYPPGSSFAAHTHELGEEFLVLEGVFADERGCYPEGTYVRNPPGSTHSPFSDQGCLLFVKLRQFDSDDSRHVAIDTNSAEWTETHTGVSAIDLHQHGQERVMLVRLAPGAALADSCRRDGVEIMVLHGAVEESGTLYPAHSWMRWPPGSEPRLRSSGGAICYVKQGHLGAPRPSSRSD
ncbi:MAG: cupin domain-containing protein [Gammaproteobacteria bacterium]